MNKLCTIVYKHEYKTIRRAWVLLCEKVRRPSSVTSTLGKAWQHGQNLCSRTAAAPRSLRAAPVPDWSGSVINGLIKKLIRDLFADRLVALYGCNVKYFVRLG